jgi:Family of unknown function (DUF6159)
MGRFENSLALAKASWRVLREEKHLTLLPLLSMVCTIVIAVSFLLPIGLIARNGTNDYSASKPAVWLLGFLAYLLLTYVVVFFNAALVHAADRHLAGEPVPLGDALKAAGARSYVLLPWALVSATVSIVLRALEERFGIVGQIVGAVAGLAWSVVTFLVLPILVIEGIGPIAAVKRSGELFKRTWGENLMTNAGIGLVSFLAMLAGAIPLALLIVVGGPVGVVGIAALVLWVILVSLVSATLTGILQVALYRFATGAEAPGFDNDRLRDTFRPRHQRGFLN